jgi:hypothetical protein
VFSCRVRKQFACSIGSSSSFLPAFLPRLGDLYQRLANTHIEFDRFVWKKKNRIAQFEAKHFQG